jgi:uroporphyrinogen decarboxylase
VQDWKGNICEIGKQFDPSFLRGAPDFVTRSWLKCPVESRDDWPDMRRRYDPDQPGRFPDDFKQRCNILKQRNYVSAWVWTGPFWQLREWCGFEGLCMLMVDDPDLVHEMVDFWEDYIAGMLERALADYVPDNVIIQEDMAYKEKPMIGPDQCRQFMVKCWTRWGDILRQAGVPVYEVDSDGHVGLLIPVWLECGINCNSPLEVAAGNDLPAYRQQYGTRMAWRGGVDKRKMAAGGQALRDEIDRLRPVIDAGGYIPSCDHGIPSDVSWPNFVEYCRLLAEATGWL